MTQKQFKRWDQYVEEAKHDAFELPVSEKETLIIEAPTGASLIQWARAYRSNDAEVMLAVLCGDQWPRVEQLLAQAGHKAMENLITDMMIHFDLAEDMTLIGPGGGKVTEKDPRKIRLLLKQGYRLEGGSRFPYLVATVDRYGDEIEYDLHQMGLDLIDFFRGRHSWRKLSNLVRQLPSSSRTIEAMADDDEMADMMMDAPKAADTGPRLSEYTPEVARLDVLVDRLSELISATIQVHGGKAPRIRPAKRPETAFSRAEKRRTEQRISSLIAEVEAAQERASTAQN
ncbi:tail assembly chaperone [Arthrobacter phage Maja]|uniref:Tail assembly chaperone n=1 Tax=Arthrobacter phage Maja TaxID=2499009 RepID=A0A3S9UMZ4_9CAUD|nr:tail assembly chaperone [Arthrobacter phage Maja]AZS11713.1 tail assembly chaperone [Arthrobacter phage Maja]